LVLFFSRGVPPPLSKINFSIRPGGTNFEGMAGGRPTDYNQEMGTRSQDYLDSCIEETVQVVIGQSEKFTSFKDKVIVKLPSIEGLARYLKIHKDTIYEWEKIHQEFSDVVNAIRSEQADRLINMGLSGDYNPMVAKLLLTKHGYADKVDQEISGKSITVTITDD